jgi:hypothetical protein
VAAATEGYAGADLAALAAGAVMAAVRRCAPGLIGDLDRQIRQPASSAAPARDPAPPAASAADVTDAPAEQVQIAGQVAEPSSSRQEALSAAMQSQFNPDAAAEPASSRQLNEPPSTSAADGPQPAGGPQQQQDEQGRDAAAALLQGVAVRAADWREALGLAPQPCARRQGLAALSAEAPRPLPARLLPALAPVLARLLAAVHQSGVPLSRSGTVLASPAFSFIHCT